MLNVKQKGARGPDEWMPRVKRCSYAQRWQSLIDKYGLMDKAQELEVIAESCE